ncbi:hypothetical protein SRABI83_00524 [Arthrobacter sp. Bi83]|uniref:hypothetical protein n=1 Tax=Arthrobacter sp. Bi83 TaxID=2822353 RepID=UPI001DEB533E|nr:hypothetical protein [Arthrobacter sp. Bi83]CAH0143127.1 hypothetical protein SRABI83_00524 [Arthrobacter sp. Bi83]
MKPARPIYLSIVVGRSSHPQAVIDDLWKRAVGAVGHDAGPVTGTAVYTVDGEKTVTVLDDRLSVVALPIAGGGRVSSLVSAAAGKPGPVGVAGRLFRDNLESRRLARSLAGRADLQERLRGSDVVVAADLTADRVVWQLRKRTDAELVHGPIAMLHALRQSVGKRSLSLSSMSPSHGACGILDG